MIAFLHVTANNSEAADFQILLQDMQSRSFHVRLSAVETIGKIGDERSVDALIDLLENKDEDWEIQIRAIHYLGESKNPRVVNILLQFFENVFLHYECPAIKWHTALALGNFKNNQKVFEALLRNLDYDNLQVREAVIKSLGAIGNRKAVPFLLPFLRENSFALNFSTIKALEMIGDPSAVPQLKIFLSDNKDIILRREALRAIRKLQTIEFQPLAMMKN